MKRIGSGTSRRRFIVGSTAALTLSTRLARAEIPAEDAGTSLPLVLSPPVVQNPTATSFSVAWRVSRQATGWVEWGHGEILDNKSLPVHHGLVMSDEGVLNVRVTGLEAGRALRYRVVTVPLEYKSAYRIQRGQPVMGEVRQLRLPRSDARKISLGIINDTHEHPDTIRALASQIEAADPDLLLWNGDVCNDFYDNTRLASICLDNGAPDSSPASGGWASTRPLLFVPGNHDVRGPSAHCLPTALLPWPAEEQVVPGPVSSAWFGGQYCFASRFGPLALIGLDTGEDKPDRREVFAGMAAYELYRETQRDWLTKVLQHPDIAAAPHLVACCHIPLRGLPNQNDGLGDEGYAGWSGQGAALWLPPLRAAGCRLVLSGHTHRHRVDPPTADEPITQVVGGSPRPSGATFLRLNADAKRLVVIVSRSDGTVLNEYPIVS